MFTADCLLQPKYEAPSAWKEHIPFAFWIVGAIQPRVIVELGVHFGMSYFAFCQMVAEKGLQTQCFGIDTWLGDEYVGLHSTDVFQKVDAYNRENYGGFSKLVRMKLNQALDRFEDGSIDILHIDGRHYYDDVKEDFETWLPKLSSCGVVLFHDTEVRERGFGVWRLWSDLEQRYPSFNFLHGHGLGIIACGSQIPPRLNQLFSLSHDADGASNARHFFQRRGIELSEMQQQQQDVKRLQKAVVTLNLDVCALENMLYRERLRPLKTVRNYVRFQATHRLATISVPALKGAGGRFQKRLTKYSPDRGLLSIGYLSMDMDCIANSGKFRKDFYASKPRGFRTDRDAIRDYLLNNGPSGYRRKPIPGFHPEIYAESLGEVVKRNMFADFLSKGEPKGPWLKQVLPNAGAARRVPTKNLRSALHLHVFYPEQIPLLLDRIQLNMTRPDLFVSTTDASLTTVRSALQNYQGKIVDLRAVPNRGRDIAPFLTQFGPALQANYDVIGHLHTKHSPHLGKRVVAESWTRFLLENLIGGEQGGAMMDTILAEMESDATIGAVYPDDPHVYGWGNNREFAESLNMGSLPERFNFPAGAMFWLRKNVFSKFVALGLSWDDYPAEPLPVDGTILHAIERLYGVMADTDGYRGVVTNVPGVTRQ